MEKYYILIAAAVAICAIWFFVRTVRGKALLNKFYDYVSTDEFRESVHQMMVYAEELIVGNKLGQERLTYVCGWIHNKLPVSLQKVVTADMLVDIVNELFEIYAVKKNGSTIVK